MNTYVINKTFNTYDEKEKFVKEFLSRHNGENILMMNSTDNSIVGDGTIILHSITTV